MTNDKDYIGEILSKFLKKRDAKTVAQNRQSNINRRIIVKPKEIYSDYEKTSADIYLKQQINEAADELVRLNFITVKKLPFSDDITNMYLNTDVLHDIDAYMNDKYGFITRCNKTEEIKRLIGIYKNKGELSGFYCEKLQQVIDNSTAEIDVDREREMLEMLAFIQSNKRNLFIREASMMVYGSSKYFEDYRCESICNIIRESNRQIPKEAENDEVLRKYGIFDVHQEICIKGEYIIEFKDYALDTKHFQGGVSISSKDIPLIKHITVNTDNIITIENKTAFQRFNKENYSTVYLSGYAKQHQIEFLQKIYKEQPELNYHHFGDIDIGGFLIHKHLESSTGIDFKLFYMGIRELNEPAYQSCLQELTLNDRERADVLLNNEKYRVVIEEMLRRNIKLEQEIICCNINP